MIAVLAFPTRALAEKERMRVRPVNHDVTGGAVLVSRLGQIMKRWRIGRARIVVARDGVRVRVTLDAELVSIIAPEQFRIIRAVRRVATGTALNRDRAVLVCEGPSLVVVALDAGRVRRREVGEARLFQLEAAVRVMAVAALHESFLNFVMEGHVELGLLLRVAAQAQL